MFTLLTYICQTPLSAEIVEIKLLFQMLQIRQTDIQYPLSCNQFEDSLKLNHVIYHLSCQGQDEIPLRQEQHQRISIIWIKCYFYSGTLNAVKNTLKNSVCYCL